MGGNWGRGRWRDGGVGGGMKGPGGMGAWQWTGEGGGAGPGSWLEAVLQSMPT